MKINVLGSGYMGKQICSLFVALGHTVNIWQNSEEKLDHIIDAEIITCEFLVANKGSILVSSNQISTKKLNEISENLIVFAKNSQFSSDVSESMSLLNSKYETKPTNITTINAFDTKSEIDFLSYGRTSKNLYLIVQE